MPNQRPALLVQLQPITPWRTSAAQAGEPASLLASDSLFGALSSAMSQLGWLSEWLAEGAPATRFSSLFPSVNDIFYAPFPEVARTYSGLRKLRLSSVRFAPMSAIAMLAARKFDENRWVLDLSSGCLQPVDRASAGSPFAPVIRHRAAVDRFSGTAAHAASIEGIEFASNAGLWALFVFADPSVAGLWSARLKAAFRLLADDGIGGWRAAGWGRSRRPRFREGECQRLLSHLGWNPPAQESELRLWWTLGLFSPAPADPIAWNSGAYSTVNRSGWTPEALAKPALRFLREGSIVACPEEPSGAILETALDGAPHPIFRYGAGLAIAWPQEVA